MKLSKKLKLTRTEALALANLGSAHKNLHQYDLALKAYRKAVRLFMKLGVPSEAERVERQIQKTLSMMAGE